MANSTHDRRRRNITEAATANNAKEDGSRMMGASGHCHRQKTDGRCSVGCPQPTFRLFGARLRQGRGCSEPLGWGQPTLQRWQCQDAPRAFRSQTLEWEESFHSVTIPPFFRHLPFLVSARNSHHSNGTLGAVPRNKQERNRMTRRICAKSALAMMSLGLALYCST